MNHDLIIVLIWLTVAISLLVLIQIAVLGGLFLALRRMLSTVKQIQRNLLASGLDLYGLAGTSYRLLQSLQIITKDSAEIVHSLKQELPEIRSRLARVDHSIAHLFDRIERGSKALKRALAQPAIQFRAVAAAVGSILGVLTRGFRDSPTQHSR